jgi:hypothetical protein
MGVLSDTDEIADELYLVPPARFVAARDELVRQARAAGNRELAKELHSLRRPTQSAWLVNVLARRERAAMEALFEIGRDLRRAQTRLDGARLQSLSARRHEAIGDLLRRARSRAAEAGMRPPAGMLAQVEETLRAGLVDLAAASTVMSGRLVRPMSHAGFGPMPQLDRPAPLRAAPPPGGGQGGTRTSEPGGESDGGHEWRFWPVEHPSLPSDELRAETGPAGRSRVGHGPGREAASSEASPPLELSAQGAEAVRRAESALAAAESAHAQRQQELAEAEAAAVAARDRIDWLNHQQVEAGREKVAAERRLADASAAQRAAAHAVELARRALGDQRAR